MSKDFEINKVSNSLSFGAGGQKLKALNGDLYLTDEYEVETWRQLRIAPAVQNDDLITYAVHSQSYNDAVKHDTEALTFSDSGDEHLYYIDENYILLSVSAFVKTPFNGSNPTLKIGFQPNYDQIWTTTICDLKTTDVYATDTWFPHDNEDPPNHDNTVRAYLDPDSSTAGEVLITLHYIRTNAS